MAADDPDELLWVQAARFWLCVVSHLHLCQLDLHFIKLHRSIQESCFRAFDLRFPTRDLAVSPGRPAVPRPYFCTMVSKQFLSTFSKCATDADVNIITWHCRCAVRDFSPYQFSALAIFLVLFQWGSYEKCHLRDLGKILDDQVMSSQSQPFMHSSEQ